jgi:hypothetical protein
MAKKQTAQPHNYTGYNSYPLTEAQIKRALAVFDFDLLEDSGTDEKAGNLLAVLRSFAYTTDNTEREEMLRAAEEALIPFIGVVSDAVTELSIRAHQQLLKVGGSH